MPDDTVAEAAATEDRATTLRALRDRLASEFDECRSMRDLVALANRLTDVLSQLEELEAAEDEPTGPTGLSVFLEKLAERKAEVNNSELAE